MINIKSISTAGLAIIVSVMGMSRTANAQAAFEHLHGGVIEGVFFLDEDRGWTAEEGGRIRWTDNGGLSWTHAEIEDSTEEIRVVLRDVFFLDIDHGFAVGDGGVVLKSDFGSLGRVWRDANFGARVTDSLEILPGIECGTNKAELFDIFMINEDIGWVVGEHGALSKTTNGGASWTPVASLPVELACGETPEDLYDVHFFRDSGAGADYSKGIVAAENGNVFTTNDSGVTWDRVNIPSDVTDLCPLLVPEDNLEIWSLSFDDPLDATSAGWAVAGVGFGKGYTFRTSNGGTSGSWEQVRCYEFLDPTGLPGQGVCGIDTQYGVAVLDAASSRVVSAGYNAEMYIYEIGTANFDACLCSTNPADECPADALTWVQKDLPIALPTVNCSDQGPLFAAAKVSSTVAVMAGAFGRIVHYDDVTGTVTDAASNDITRLNAGEFINSLIGCVFGQGRVIKRTTDGGVTWTKPTVNWDTCVGSTQGLDLDFSSFSGVNGAAVGTGGFVAYSTDSGASWTRVLAVDLPAGLGDLNAVAFVPVGFLPPGATTFAVGSAGVILRSFDNGATWDDDAVIPGLTESLLGVSFATPNVGYVVGANQTVYRTANGSDPTPTWTAVAVIGGNAGEAFLDVETWGNGSAAILVSQNGGVFERNGGRFVKQDLGLNPAVAENLNDVEVLNNGDNVRICGDNGVVLFRDAGLWTRPRSWTNNPLFKLSFQGPNQGFGIGRNFVILDYSP